MALKGQLSDFNLAEILQLIAGQQKSGFLILEAQREMVFVFDKGVLISTRDRRTEAADPLETYLHAYGFFSEAQWKHIEFVRSNSSLDLTEILVSEQLVDENSIIKILQNVAQEMAHVGVKLRRGRYHFTATRGTPPGVRWRYQMEVQGLLMEAMRRLDEEPQLLETLPSQALTFAPGPEAVDPESLADVQQRLLKLALAGQPLGRIIRQGKIDSFTVREVLKNFCDDGLLTVVLPDPNEGPRSQGPKKKSRRNLDVGLKSNSVTIAVLLVVVAFGGLRWGPLWAREQASVGLAAPVATATDTADSSQSVPDDRLRHAARDLRLRQIKAEVTDAIELFRFQHGTYPTDLAHLVGEGMLAPSTERVVSRLGWHYSVLKQGQGYSLVL
jgi:hypothetical protein